VSAGPTPHVAVGPSGSLTLVSYEYRVSSVAVNGALVVMTGSSLTGVIVIVAVSVSDSSPSDTTISSVQLAGGVGPAGVKV
jgi:hypothetical protein